MIFEPLATVRALEMVEAALEQPKLNPEDAEVLAVIQPHIRATAQELREQRLVAAAIDVIDIDDWQPFMEMVIRLAEGYRSEATHWNWDQWNARVYALVGVLEAEREGLS